MILKNKLALITGATGEIGKTTARFFANEGCDLILVGRSEKELKKLQVELSSQKVKIEIHQTEVDKIKEVKELFKFVEKKFDQLDILVTTAGVYGEIGSLENCNLENWDTAIKVNLLGTVYCVKYALPLLKKSSHGKIIVFAGGGEGPMPNFTSYASSKAGILRFTESVFKELADYKIDINAVSPGLVNSGLVQDLISAGPEKVGQEKFDEAKAEMVGRKKTESPEKAARLIVWLASEKSNGLSGKNISAVWDRYENFPNHLKEIMESDVYNFRRVKPKDRGYDW